MDPRFSMARTYEALDKAGMSSKGFEDEINQCTGPENALEICKKWRKIAEANLPY